jgi:hypothetical protein
MEATSRLREEAEAEEAERLKKEAEAKNAADEALAKRMAEAENEENQ